MKIIIFTHYLKSGGAEKRASIYANYLFNSGHQVTIVTNFPIENEYFVDKKITRIYLFDSLKEYKQKSIKHKIQLVRSIYEKIDPDFVISFLPTYSLYSALAVKFSKKLKSTKTIYSVSLYQRKYGLILRLVDFFACLFSSTVVLQCNEQRKCNRLFKKKCVISYNPVVDIFKENYNRNYENIKLLSVGRLVSQKSFKSLIKYVIFANKFFNNISLDIYGKGPLRDKLNNFIKKNKADGFIKIYDFTLDIIDVYKNHNFYVLMSKYEGFPNSLVEAMCCGLVCLSKPCPTGPKEIIRSGKNGYIFKTKKQFLSILKELNSNHLKCKKISNNARSDVLSQYEQNVVLKDYLNNILS